MERRKWLAAKQYLNPLVTLFERNGGRRSLRGAGAQPLRNGLFLGGGRTECNGGRLRDLPLGTRLAGEAQQCAHSHRQARASSMRSDPSVHDECGERKQSRPGSKSCHAAAEASNPESRIPAGRFQAKAEESGFDAQRAKGNREAGSSVQERPKARHSPLAVSSPDSDSFEESCAGQAEQIGGIQEFKCGFP